ncbi:fat-like cadherin-related tumor suppressor homolog, partial [Nilaparvata lugens]|uniref:fat-like cadherin-related tumor suppressor homolog n=1 Tax=Nilaparvata lugens TaxID=108931 RepID=UPI00193E3C87
MLWYYIVGGDPRSEFVISGDKGSVLVAKQLDREVQSEYNLTISVTDGVHTVLTQLYVTVMDINEHRPWFTQNLYSANVSESTPVGTEVVQLQATDEDQDSKVLYSLHSARSPASLAAFKVDYQTGVITVVQSLDRESIAEHLLTVMVKDAGTPAKRNFARVVIHVYDANDHAPEFSSAIIQGRVFETADVGSAVVTVLAVDKDHGNNAVITYSITSDMNSIAEYMLIVKAVDGGATPLSSTLPVHIMVVMADNAAPRFLKREVAAELYENEPAGAVVKHLEARSTSSLLFELIRGDSEGHFAVDPSTGVVTTQQPLDYETNRVFNLSVTATSMAGAKAVCHVIVHVLDRNDNAPRFVQAAYEGK